MTDDVDRNRRHFLTVATAVTGGAGLIAATIPFVASMKPSARAQALGAPVEVPVGMLEPGEMIRVMWRGRLVYVLRRTDEMLSRLASVTEHLDDPDSENVEQQPLFAVNEHRSARPEYLVVVANCTHLGCVPLFRPDLAPADLGPDWPGGFYCPCHGSKFDMAGRVFKNVPAPRNLDVPPYRYVSDTVIQIGAEGGQA